MDQSHRNFFVIVGTLFTAAVITMKLFSASLDTGLMSTSPSRLFSIGNGLVLINIVLIRIALRAGK